MFYSFIELRKKLLNFFESSDHFEPSDILKIMPQSYLMKERVLLLAKGKRYKEVRVLCEVYEFRHLGCVLISCAMLNLLSMWLIEHLSGIKIRVFFSKYLSS